VITGGIGLLGKQHCEVLSEAGAHVVVADINEQKCKTFAANLKPRSIGIGVDITDPESIRMLCEKILETFGQVDILVNNAAVNDMFENPNLAADQSKFEKYPLDMLRKSIDVNVIGTVLCSQILGSKMAAHGGGVIINIASTYGIVAPDQSLYQDSSGKQVFYKSPAYPTTKGAVLAFTRYLAAYWGSAKVRINALSPGGVENDQDPFFIEKYSSRTPLGRMAQPNDYKGALLFLCSDASSYMTGANLVVDGGWTIW
jgi:NAD(P)-dependent dehydrogenase (short-subunit alcohol dehydrogenase family)